MKIFTSVILKAKLVFVALVVAAMLVPVSTQTASAQSIAGCYIYIFSNSPTWLYNRSFESCATTIQANGGSAEFSFGYWGNYPVAVHLYGNAFYKDANGQWHYYGIVDTGLISQCIQGNTQACSTYQIQANYAMEQISRLYGN